jgi:hypothetical protein
VTVLLRTAVVLALLAVAPATDAEDPSPALPWALQARGGRVLATVDLAPALPPNLQRLLSNGLTDVIALHVALLPERGDEPAALYVRTIDVLYDVWEETYGVTVKDPSTPRGRARTFRRFEELRSFLVEASGIDLGPLEDLGNGRWVLQTRLEVNPVSKELLERTRDFIANPSATGRGGAPSRSVLGAMASYLLRGADPGADVHRFRTPPFTARELGLR